MLSFDLPEPGTGGELACTDVDSAKRWVATLPLAQAQEAATALLAQVMAVDAAGPAVANRLQVLDLLRRAALQVQPGLEGRCTRKPLPLSADIQAVFELARNLWRALSIAYLRAVPGQLPADVVVPLHRAAVTLRQEQYLHFLAAYEVPDDVNRLLYAILLAAEEADLLRQPVPDKDLGFAEDSNILGHVAWAFLLNAVDPYRLSLAQLAVTNRAFSRWREMAGFQATPPGDSKAKVVPLPFILPRIHLPDGALRWLEVRAVVRKMRKRVESLEAGETPEALKLGRELSVNGCIALMHLLEKALRPRSPEGQRRSLPVPLAFGPEQAYVAIERRPLNSVELDASSKSLAHERMAVFGFDNVSGLAVAVNKAEAVTETWEMAGDYVWRKGGAIRHQAPVLVALLAGAPEGSHLGILSGLHITVDGTLAGHLHLYPDQPVAARLRPSGPLGAKAPRIPAFLLPDESGHGFSLVVPPTAGVRPNTGLALDDSPVEHLLIGEVLERGSDFVRYACRAN